MTDSSNSISSMKVPFDQRLHIFSDYNCLSEFLVDICYLRGKLSVECGINRKSSTHTPCLVQPVSLKGNCLKSGADHSIKERGGGIT